MKKYAIIVAGGIGSRMKVNMPKQFLLLKNKPILFYTLETFLKSYADLQIILVLPQDHLTAGQDIMTDLVPIMDDFERALQNMDKKGDVKTIRQGVDLVFNKFKSTLESKGLKSFKSIDQDFDPEIHEAITRIPAPNKKQIGKVVDEVEKGYMLNDKVIRYAKVVVGQ